MDGALLASLKLKFTCLHPSKLGTQRDFRVENVLGSMRSFKISMFVFAKTGNPGKIDCIDCVLSSIAKLRKTKRLRSKQSYQRVVR